MAEYSIMQYQHFLAWVIRNNHSGIGFPDKILYFCYYFRFITYREFQLLFPGQTDDYLSVTLNRLLKRGLLERMESVSSFNAYRITSDGMKHVRKKLEKLVPSVYPIPVEPTYNFGIDELFSFFEERSHLSKPAYWFHFFGIRDFYFAFLSNPMTASDFLFQQEVDVEGGRPLSIYENYLNSSLNRSSKLRSDGVLDAICPSDSRLHAPLFLEFDSGSQNSSILVDKVNNYVNNFLPALHSGTAAFTMPPSIVFSISAKYSKRKKPMPVKHIGGRAFLKSLEEAVILCDVLSVLENPPTQFIHSEPTLNDCISFLQEHQEELSDTKAGELLLALEKYNNNFPFQSSFSLSSIVDSMSDTKDKLDEEYKNKTNAYYFSYYMNRRNLLWNNSFAADNKDLSEALRLGMSIYSVSHELMQEQLPFLLPELYWYSSFLKTYLEDFGSYIGNLSIAYSNTGKLTNYLLRNHYAVTDREDCYHLFIENISDDMGGYFRIMDLLAMTKGNAETKGVKILCIAADDFLATNLKDITASRYFQSFLPLYKPQWDKLAFEILFATPKDFDAGRFFSLSADGKRTYKIRSDI